MAEERDAQAVDYDLTCWYIDQRRLLELLDSAVVLPLLAQTARLPGTQLQSNAQLGIFKQQITSWLRTRNPPTLGKLLLSGTLRENSIFTHYTNFFLRGFKGARPTSNEASASMPMAEAYAKLDEFQPDGRLEFKFHHEHLTSNSAWRELCGQKRLMVLGIRATPIRDSARSLARTSGTIRSGSDPERRTSTSSFSKSEKTKRSSNMSFGAAN